MSRKSRHMKDVLEEVGIEVTKDNTREIDRAIHDIVNVGYKNCCPTLKAVKEIKGDEKAKKRFVEELKKQPKA